MDSPSSPVSTSPAEPMSGRLFGQYQLVRKIAEGGMGAVYEARRTTDGERAAVKVLLRGLESDKDASTRFLNEGKSVSLVSHPSLVRIFEYSTSADGEPYIAMEYLDGQPMRAALEERYLGASALPLMRQLASALAATHQKRIVHRDLKPENIMLVRDPEAEGGLRAKILDFGIAKLLPDGASEEERRSFKTRTGTLIGTPTYMSPEQCRASGLPNDRTDVYSLGIIFYELLDGEPPFVSDSAGELFALQMFGTPPQIKDRVPGLAPKLAALVQRLLAKKPDDRPSMLDIEHELASIPSTQLADGTLEMRPCALRKRDKGAGHDDGSASRELRATLDTHTSQSNRGESLPSQPGRPPRTLIFGGIAVLAVVTLLLLAVLRPRTQVRPAQSPQAVPDLARPLPDAAPARIVEPPAVPAPAPVPDRPAAPGRPHKERTRERMKGKGGSQKGGSHDADNKVDLWQ